MSDIKRYCNEIKKILGESKLAREDGNAYMLRYDSKSCRLFLFFNLQIINKINQDR